MMAAKPAPIAPPSTTTPLGPTFGSYTPLTVAAFGFGVHELLGKGSTTWFATMTFEAASTPAGATGKGRAAFSPMTLTRPVGADAPPLFERFAQDEVSERGKVALLDDKGNSALTITLTDASLTRYTQYVQDAVLTEEVSISYTGISFKLGA